MVRDSRYAMRGTGVLHNAKASPIKDPLGGGYTGGSLAVMQRMIAVTTFMYCRYVPELASVAARATQGSVAGSQGLRVQLGAFRAKTAQTAAGSSER
jgi:hypothetical protein